MVGGYMGRILKVNLSDGTVKILPTDMQIARKYLGGKGYAVRMLYDYLQDYKKEGKNPKDVNPLGPENVLIFATGPATGISGFPESGRYHVMALKSPLTGGVASANSGGKFGPFMKFSGFDIVVIEGSSEEPVYLEISDGTAEIKDASSIWGMNTFDTTRTLTRKYGDCSIACIGPAGENLVYFACIMNEEHRAAGRTGVGAVMGSKKLKALVVSGKERPSVAKPEDFKKESKKAIEKLRQNPVTSEGLPKYGTAVLVNIINNAGALPFKNWQTSYNEIADEISGETLAEKYLRKRTICWGCNIGCGRATEVKEGPFKVLNTEGPEYESIWALGNDTGVMDLGAIIKANHFCDEFGIDTISMGSTIACAMELYEKGYIKDEDLQGLDLSFGNAAAMVEAVWRTAYKAGFGKYLALGSKRLAEIFGAPDLSMSVKGLEMPAYDPRGIKGIGLNYATANRGGCHVTGYTVSPEIIGFPEKIDPLSYEGKASWVKTFQDFTCVVNSTVNCLFSTFALGAEDYASLLAAVTGWDLTTEELMKIGERIYNLERIILNEYGFDAKDDVLPRRLLQEPLPEGAAKGHVVELDEMKDEYYRVRGWIDGKPTRDKLEELEIP
ncbi:aldehyde ferredoxin oxidoreductase [Archaeoglobales archaeon ex4484_92]|nr:MAG: aldehyde ferredoxin oxidoreductase [Archaeoglobales archaeon ex4484_92]